MANLFSSGAAAATNAASSFLSTPLGSESGQDTSLIPDAGKSSFSPPVGVIDPKGPNKKTSDTLLSKAVNTANSTFLPKGKASKGNDGALGSLQDVPLPERNPAFWNDPEDMDPGTGAYLYNK